MSSRKECAEYFKRQRGYDRCFLAMRKKWESYGRVSGRIVLRDAAEDEKRAMSGILGRAFYGDEIRFTMNEFQEALHKTRFSPITVQELLEEYFGEALCTNQERAVAKEEEKQDFFQHLLEYCGQEGMGQRVRDWFQAMMESREYGYHLLMAEYRKDFRGAALMAENTAAALGELLRQREEASLAVFSAKCTKNPHYFDRGTTAGTLLLHGICFLEQSQFPKNAYEWRTLLLRVGIVPDTISNMVAAYGIHLQREDGLHPAYEAFCQMGQPGIITMENLKGVEGAYSDTGKIYIVENEMVFSYLLECVKELPAALICTSGQLRAAALELIRLLVQSGTELHYSGDIDPDGMLIADKLWKKYPEHVHIWRMSAGDYVGSLSEENISGQQMAKLELLENPRLRETAVKIKEIKKAAYQENLKEELRGDLHEKFRKPWC